MLSLFSFQILKRVYLPEDALVWLAEKQSKQASEPKVSIQN